MIKISNVWPVIWPGIKIEIFRIRIFLNNVPGSVLADDLVVSSTKLAKSGIDLRYFHVGPTYLGQP